jgi:hypothetical protein
MPPQTESDISPTTLPSPLLRKIALLSFFPALPLCVVAHGALSHEIVPALGLIPLFFSAATSLFLLLSARRETHGKGKGRQSVSVVEGEDDLEALIGGREHGDRVRDEEEDVGGRELEPGSDEGDEDEGVDGKTSMLTHRIVVFVVDVVLAAGLMAVLVFTWLGTGRSQHRPRADLAMLVAYSTMPLLGNL